MDSMSRSRRRRGPRGPGASPGAETASPRFLLAPGFETSFQGGLQAENQAAGGSLLGNGSSRPKGQESFVEGVDDAPRTSGAPYMTPFSPSYGGNSSLFSPMHLFSPQQPAVQHPPPSVLQQQQQQQQQQHQQQLQSFTSGFNWQSLLGGQQTFLQGFAFGPEQGLTPSSSLPPYIHPEESWLGGREGDANGASDLSLGDDSSESDESSKGEVNRTAEGKEKAGKQGNSRKEKRRKFRGSEKGDVKREGSNLKEAFHTPRDGVKMRKKKHKQKKPQEALAASEAGQLEESMNFELSASSSETGSSSDDSDRDKKESINKKRKRAGQDADGNVTWTDESVRFLFETYDAIHQRLWEESNGQVKYQKKWTPILKAMQDKFGKHFSKKQCQSKYWSVRRECTDYRYMSAKAARSDPSWNPSIAGRELLKPKFYDVWFEVSGKHQAVVTKSNPTKTTAVREEGYVGQGLKNSSGLGEPWKLMGNDGQLIKHKVKDCGSAMKEMQQLMQVQLQASEKREEAMKYRAELMMDLLTQHMEHVEKRVSNLEEGRQPQLYLLERVNHKLEKVLDGFTALNDNLSTIAFKITQNHPPLG